MRVALERIKTDAGRRWATARKDRLVRIIAEGWWYWRPNRIGYTNLAERAGVYTLEDAIDASGHCGTEKRIVYEFLPEGQYEPTQAPSGPAMLMLRTKYFLKENDGG